MTTFHCFIAAVGESITILSLFIMTFNCNTNNTIKLLLCTSSIGIYFATATSGTNFSPKSLEPLYKNFRCYGNESSLMNCLYSSSPCTHYWRTDAAVKCAGDIVSGNYIDRAVICQSIMLAVALHFLHFAGTCLQGSIRLVGPNGPNTVEGRVEYCSNALWGTISSFGFDTRDGEVVCRRLGYQHPRKLACMMYNGF